MAQTRNLKGGKLSGALLGLRWSRSANWFFVIVGIGLIVLNCCLLECFALTFCIGEGIGKQFHLFSAFIIRLVSRTG